MFFFIIIVGGEGRENRGPRGDRGDYRRKEGGANGDFKPEFRGGLGKNQLNLFFHSNFTNYLSLSFTYRSW